MFEYSCSSSITIVVSIGPELLQLRAGSRPMKHFEEAIDPVSIYL